MALQSLKIPLLTGRYYHLYNRGNNKEKLFYFHGNYQFFLDRYFKYLDTYVETYCYCLLPNHFHFLIRIRDEGTNPKIVSNQFRKLFISYSRHINKQQNRVGCLLSKNFQRIEIHNDKYLKNIVLYIHNNPIKHGIHYDLTNYYHSTYYQMIRNNTTKKEFDEILNWFGNYQEFLYRHNNFKDDIKTKRFTLEE